MWKSYHKCSPPNISNSIHQLYTYSTSHKLFFLLSQHPGDFFYCSLSCAWHFNVLSWFYNNLYWSTTNTWSLMKCLPPLRRMISSSSLFIFSLPKSSSEGIMHATVSHTADTQACQPTSLVAFTAASLKSVTSAFPSFLPVQLIYRTREQLLNIWTFKMNVRLCTFLETFQNLFWNWHSRKTLES